MQPGMMTIAGKLLRLDVVVATYDFWALEEALPFPRFSVRVVHRPSADYQAAPNVIVRNVTTGDVEYTCGIGGSINEAVEDALSGFLKEVEKQSQIRELAEDDFVWVTDW